MGAPGMLERVALADPHVELALGDPVQDVARPPLELLARGDVAREARTRQVQRLRLQLLRVVVGAGPEAMPYSTNIPRVRSAPMPSSNVVAPIAS